MPSAANLGDPLEGTQPLGHDGWWQSLTQAAKSDQERETIQHNKQLLARFAAAFRTRYYVSCWHMNEAENPHMWSQYTTSTDAVAVRTTLSRLRELLQPYVGIGLVRYINYSTERLPTLNMFEYITHKNIVFSPEAELRAVAMHPVIEGLDQQHFREHHFQKNSDPAVLVYAPPVDIQKLIAEVALHPESTKAFRTRIEEVCKNAGLPAPVSSAAGCSAA